jgi:hypothetical protein
MERYNDFAGAVESLVRNFDKRRNDNCWEALLHYGSAQRWVRFEKIVR